MGYLRQDLVSGSTRRNAEHRHEEVNCFRIQYVCKLSNCDSYIFPSDVIQIYEKLLMKIIYPDMNRRNREAEESQ